ncbi:MAG: RNA polymerase sigma factor [Gemmatimonadetes bacterium]|nr:RNA polymerase sigma factor [Gemmatimonadota bacterium]NNM06153.1 RNA polymerase sigma factor [Gemmatimonadota bacterium]
MKRPPSKLDPDPVLIRSAQAGNRKALRSLLEEIGPAVRQWALAYEGDADAAADLTQEVFLVLLRKIGSYRGEARFLTWLFSVTRNQALEECRRKARQERKMRRLKVETGNESGAPASGGTTLDRERLGRLIQAFVDELPARQREVFQLSELQCLTSPEVGEILDLAPASVRAALLKARRSLRRKILERHPEFVEEFLP